MGNLWYRVYVHAFEIIPTGSPGLGETLDSDKNWRLVETGLMAKSTARLSTKLHKSRGLEKKVYGDYL